MKQKLALACTLVHEPKVILLDEPTTGVDPVSRREFWKLLSQFLAQGITILMSTPYLDEAERCTRIVLLHEGQVLALDEPGALRSSLPGTLLEVLVATPREALRALKGPGGVKHAQVFGDRLHVWSDRTTAADATAEFAAIAARAGVATSRRPRHRPVARRRLHRQTRFLNRDCCLMMRTTIAVLLFALSPLPLAAQPASIRLTAGRGDCQRLRDQPPTWPRAAPASRAHKPPVGARRPATSRSSPPRAATCGPTTCRSSRSTRTAIGS